MVTVESNSAVLWAMPESKVSVAVVAKLEHNWKLVEMAESNWQYFAAEKLENIWE